MTRAGQGAAQSPGGNGITISDGGWIAPVVVVGGCVVGTVVVGAVVVAVVVGGSVVVGAVVVGGWVVVVVVGAVGGGSVVGAAGGISLAGVFGATGSGLGAAGTSAGVAVVDETDVVAGAVGPGSLFTSRTIPHTSAAIRSAVSTPQPISANGLRYHGVDGGPGGSDQSGCGPVGSRYWLE